MIDWDKKDIYLVEKIYGPEPSLRDMIFFYFANAGVGTEPKQAEKLVERYIKKYEKQTKGD